MSSSSDGAVKNKGKRNEQKSTYRHAGLHVNYIPKISIEYKKLKI